MNINEIILFPAQLIAVETIKVEAERKKTLVI